MAAVSAGVLLAVAAGCGSSGSDGGSGGASAADASSSAALLGPAAPASGAPVKIGLISDGKAASSDTSVELRVAEATVKYFNAHKAGIGGRPIELVTCSTANEASKGTDCANQAIEQKVAAVVVGASAVAQAVWTPLHAAKIPVLFYSTNDPEQLKDAQSTFTLGDPNTLVADAILPLAAKANTRNLTAVVIDVPPALAQFEGANAEALKKAGIKLKLIPIPLGTADMTPQLQSLSGSAPGVVEVVGNDSFCISAFNALRTAGFTGPFFAIPQCISDATRKAVPSDVLERITVGAAAPVNNDNPSTRLYQAVVDAYGKNIKADDSSGLNMFSELSAFQVALADIKGDITPATVISTFKSMPEKEIPGAGGLKLRCNGKAYPATPALCVRGSLTAQLDGKGNPASYRVVGYTPIPS
ncbi:ABC transporter substrate-binding protein [Frankia sp. AgPm24]|uniref:ABC transporter substrate-binding protein n=1 Tax=Frankia sp. AgPm24 TaxID=631128 RepID=UPI00200C33A6|nr:ABC transporter substrate-binding protein [Frankia sp. AgPm24]MCK9925067.1 ABC transporter substrate-binding protein [Frankia sp. AgPm24]